MNEDAFPEQISTKTQNCFYIIWDLAKEAKHIQTLQGDFHINHHGEIVTLLLCIIMIVMKF